MNRLEHKIPPPFVVLLVGVLMWTIASFEPQIPLDQKWRWAIAGVMFVAGLAVAGQGIRGFSRAATTINPIDIGAASTLVTDGIFSYSRNPMYVGMTSLLLSWALLLSGAWTLLGPIAFVAFITRFQIIPEEAVLTAKFGTAFDIYKSRVRRWL